MNECEVLADNHPFQRELLGFERRHGIHSETLHVGVCHGEEAKDDA